MDLTTNSNVWIQRSLIRILMLPVLAFLTIMQWICIMIVSISAIVFHLIGGIFIIIGLLVYLFGEEPLLVMIKAIIFGISIRYLPVLEEWIAVRLVYLIQKLKEKMTV